MTLTKRSWQMLVGVVLLSALSTLPVCGFAVNAGPGLENNTSRWGFDYKRFTIGSAEACAAACAADAQCRAWSYIKPSLSTPSAMCRLKSAVPQAAADPCCTSGLAATTVGGAADKSRQVAAASKSAPAPTGVTGSIRKKGKAKTRPQAIASAKPPGEVLQMPMEAETPEALTAIGAPIDMPEPTLGD